ncbi:Gfo/Idh/MocA family oxidoreductase [Nonomuraea sp. 3-1Str]|uniref:Gfo/Idh/MocA family oxidoreductase n=1 Tax=Nonomuraea sp. 3-1Str TaxID=2929801 RepID=UPI0028551A42|nr:Gfo/Idh/MocA family oxidoreductase [Nonomuraea sp. 3-1Str]MDR8414106.1 Gfo/Idh/MocA family oxidoreductase [Nonomuraea sp. 3-1Str]
MTIRAAVVGGSPLRQQAVDDLLHNEDFQLDQVLSRDPVVDSDGAPADMAWESLLLDAEIRLIILCTHTVARVALVRQAAEAGKAVLLQEPAPSSQELAQLRQLARRDAALIGVMMPFRMALPAEVRTWLWTATTCGTLEVSRSHPFEEFRNPLWFRWGPTRQKRALARILTPYLDLACQLLGEPIDTRIQADDEPGGRALGLVSFHNGSRLAFAGTTCSAVPSERLSLFDTDAHLTVSGDTLVFERMGSRATREIPPVRVLRRLVYQEIAASIESGTPLRHSTVGASDGLAAILTSFVTLHRTQITQ